MISSSAAGFSSSNAAPGAGASSSSGASRRGRVAALSIGRRPQSGYNAAIESGREDAPMGRLDNKVAVVTGSASGMGRASAIRFAQEGAAVVVADLNSQGGELVVSEIA